MPSLILSSSGNNDANGALMESLLVERLAVFELRLTKLERKVTQMNDVSKCVHSLKTDVADLKVKVQSPVGLPRQEALINNGRKCVVSLDKLLEEQMLSEDWLSMQEASDNNCGNHVVSCEKTLEGSDKTKFDPSNLVELKPQGIISPEGITFSHKLFEEPDQPMLNPSPLFAEGSKQVGIDSQVGVSFSPSSDINDKRSTLGSRNTRATGSRSPASLLKRRSSNKSDASQTLGPNEFKLEENIYGLLALPNRPLTLGAFCIVLCFYALTTGLILIIYASMVSTAHNIRDELYNDNPNNEDPLCKQVFDGKNYMWDCGPPRLDKLMDFHQLDLDGDGVWSVAEARNSSLLPYFRALSEVALEQESLLTNVFPPIPATPDAFCSVLLSIGASNANVVQSLAEVDQVAMFETSGRLTPDMMARCHAGSDGSATSNLSAIFSMPVASYKCLLEALCPLVPVIPGSSSQSQFYQTTSHMSAIPSWLHMQLSQKMLRACHLLDPELCANADVQQHSLLAEVWPHLSIDEAVIACSNWISDMCPRLLGEDFKATQVRMGVACGERSYKVVRKQERTSPFNFVGDSLQCKDPDDNGKTAIPDIVQTTTSHIPVFKYLIHAEEAFYGLPRGFISKSMDCTIGYEVFAWQNFQTVDPRTNLSSSTADVYGRTCPSTSCQRRGPFVAHACPAQCLHKVEESSAVIDPFKRSFGIGEYTQIGFCRGFETQVDTVSGALKVSRFHHLYGWERETCEMVLHLNKTARVYVTAWNVPTRERKDVFSGLCREDYLMINGKKHCTTEKPPPVTLTPQAGGFTELEWAICETCGPLDYDSEGFDKWKPIGFELVIVDAAVPTEHILVTVDFELHKWYWNDVNGVTEPIFHIFLILIILVWIGYLGDEFFSIVGYIKFIMQAFNGTKMHKLLLLVFLAFPRVLIWGFVLYTGILLLATANSYIDLVLNSVALAFVLEFDEYLYVMSVPISLKMKVVSHEIVELRPWGISKLLCPKKTFYNAGVLIRMAVFIIVAIVVVHGLYNTDLFGSPNFNKVSQVYDCLCALRGPHCPAY